MPRKRKGLIIALIITAVIIAIAVVFTILFFTTDIFKNGQQAFLQAKHPLALTL